MATRKSQPTASGKRRVAMPQSNPRRRADAASRPRRSGASQSVSSVRIGDLESSRDRAARRRQERPARDRQAPRFLKPFVVVVLVVAVVTGAATALYNSNAFAVAEVRVTGVSHLTADEMAELAAVPAGSTLLRVDAEGIESRLESNAWVADAKVKRIFPDTLELAVSERRIAAVVSITSTDAQQTENWAIADDGMWLIRIPDASSEEAQTMSPQIYSDAMRVLRITDVPYGTEPVVGAQCNDASVLNALNIVSQLSTDLSSRVATVSATDTANTQLTLDDGVQIAFGPAQDVRDKERVVLELLSAHPGQIAYINVRVVDRPTWRGLE